MACRKYTVLLITATLACWFSGCASFHAAIPDGFAAYKQTGTVRAVSPDGIVFKVFRTANKPYAELPFWQEALCTRMRNAGYTFLDSISMTVAGCPAFLLETAAPVGAEDQSYLIAILLNKKQIIIAESAGEVVKFRSRKPAVIEAIKKISF